MRISLFACAVAFVGLIWWLRRSGNSVGLPAAYLGNLLVLHVPGAVGQVLDRENLIQGDAFTRTGMIMTAIGTVAFVVGALIGRRRVATPTPQPAARSVFWRYCLLGGGVLTVVAYAINIPSVTAVIAGGGPIWMLGVMLALRSATRTGDGQKAFRWLVALTLYPVLILFLTGFMSYGSVAAIIVLTGIAMVAASGWRVALGYAVAVVAGISIFLSYYSHRDQIRAAVWGGADTDARIAASVAAFSDLELFDPRNGEHLVAFDERLNQNYFVGLAAARIESGAVNPLYGRSLVEGVQALVPRALWPDKPVVAGSPKIVSEMTGLTLGTGTSFGVGNVMEFHINFGIPGVVIGFLLLGAAIGWLDVKTAAADLRGDLRQTFLFFLPAVALIQPNGSIVEILSGAAAALAAALAWRWLWDRWPKPQPSKAQTIARTPFPQTI